MLRFIVIFFLVCPALIQGELRKGSCGCPNKKKDDNQRGGLIGGVVGIVTNVCPHTKRILQPPKPSGSSKAPPCTCENVLPPLLHSETYIAYIRRVFASKGEATDKYFARIFRQYENESNASYVRRIDAIFAQFPWLICKYNLDYYKVAALYYKLKYGRIGDLDTNKHENEDEYFKRILEKIQGEDFDSYIKRMDCVYKSYPCLKIWRRIQFDKDAGNWHFYRQGEYCSNIRPSLNIRESLREVYKRRDFEEGDDYSYYKRICDRRTGESDKDYVDRLNKIQIQFKDLPLWYNIEYINLVKEYYLLIYGKNNNENLTTYYKRITYKSNEENLNLYIKRMNILEILFHHLPLWNNEDFLELTQTYYRIIYGKLEGENDEKYLQRVTAKSCSENVDVYLQRMNIVRWVCKSTDFFYNKKYFKYTKAYFQYFYKRCSETDEVWLARIFKRSFQENDDEYVKRLTIVRLVQGNQINIDITEKCLKYVSEYYRLLYRKRNGESKEDWIKRITTRDVLETEGTYQMRLKFLGNVYTECKNLIGGLLKQGKNLISTQPCSKQKGISNKSSDEEDSTECDSSEEDSSEEENKLKKKKSSLEKEESSSESGECLSEERDDKTKLKRKKQKKRVQKASDIKQKNVKDETVGEQTLAKEIDSDCKKTVSDNNIKEIYAKKDGEDILAYFKRIVNSVSKTKSIEEYVKTLTSVRKYYPDLSLWYDINYIELVRDYYNALYNKKSSESDNEQFVRIVIKEAFESEEQCARRVEVIRQILPNLTLWANEEYYEKYTKKIYQIVFARINEDEISYCKRVIARSIDETETIYIGRLSLIEKAFNSLPLWYSEKTFSIVKQYYILKYAQRSGECDENYFKRLVAKQTCDSSDEIYGQRINLVHQATILNILWYDEKYYETYTKTYYFTYYKKGNNVACDTWLAKVFKQLTGESEDNALKRITLVKKSTSGCSCNCWTLENFNKVESTNTFSKGYITKIKKMFFASQGKGSTFEKKISSKSSSSKSELSSESEEEISIKNGV